MKTQARHWFIFSIAVLVLAWYYDYPHWIMERPQSTHNWRQSDCASLTLNYHQQELPFTKPQTHGMVSDGGTSSKNAPSEMSIYYWGVAQLYSFFGPSETILRGLNTFFFLSGIVGFMWGLFHLSNNLTWSVLLGLVIFTSPVLVYYGSNYLTNAPSFGMALWGLSFFIVFTQSGRIKYWWGAVFFYFLAGCFKLPGLFLLFSIGGVIAVSRFKRHYSIPALSFWKYLSGILIILIPVMSWVLYARKYNLAHDTVYFSTTTFPMWSYSWPEVQVMFSQMISNWGYQYFHPVSYVFFLFLLFFCLVRWRKMRSVFRGILGVLLLGLSFYFVLQFFTFVDHDYYTINMFILPAFLLVLFTDYLLAWKPALLKSPLMQMLLALFVAGNAIYAREQLTFRYHEYPNNFRKERPLLYQPDTEDWLNSLGVGIEDSIIFIPDFSHTSLYLLNRYGWTNSKMVFKDSSRNIYFNQDAEGVQRSIERGARYLLVYGVENIYDLSYLHPFEKHLSGEKEGLYVFDLQDTVRNFKPGRGELYSSQFFDFENELPLRWKGTSISSDHALSGTYSLAGANTPYLTSVSLHSLKAGMLIEVEVWIHKGEEVSRVLPVIQSEESGLLFRQEEKVTNHREEWQLFSQSYVVTEKVARKGVKVFLWNPEKAPVWFDDYKITVYSSPVK